MVLLHHLYATANLKYQQADTKITRTITVNSNTHVTFFYFVGTEISSWRS